MDGTSMQPKPSEELVKAFISELVTNHIIISNEIMSYLIAKFNVANINKIFRRESKQYPSRKDSSEMLRISRELGSLVVRSVTQKGVLYVSENDIDYAFNIIQRTSGFPCRAGTPLVK